MNETLVLKRFSWSDGKEQIAEGTANLPVPEDFSKWREMLATDTRPVNVTIQSQVLSLGLIKEWVPAAEKLDPRSTGQLDLSLSGTYADPIVDALFKAKDLRSPEKPNLPPADLIVTVKAGDNNLVVTATATAPDFPAAEMRAAMPFRPSEWAENPALFQEEPLNVRLDLPRLDLSRFTSLVPEAQQITGSLTGNAVVTGKINKPEMKGEIDLTGGAFRFKNDRFPAVESINGAVELLLDKVTLKSLKATMAGGTIDAGGSLAITDGKPGNLDFRFRGAYLPLLRNDFLILRSNLDLTLKGPLATAALAGTVGFVDSVFFREIELLPIGVPFNSPSAAALPKIDVAKKTTSSLPEPFRNWGLNITVRTQDPILIRGNLASGEIKGSMKMEGTLGNPLPDGQFLVKDFRASLPFSTLTIPTGEINFTPAAGLDPILEIRGIAEPRPYRVTIYAYGRLSNPQLVLTSNPPLPDNEIMTLLATGTTTSGLEDPQVASSRAIQLLAEELRRGRFIFGKQLRPLLGLLDRVDFSVAESDPYSDASFSTATIAITDRWYVAAGLDSEGDSRAMVIWRLSFR
jgi:autotransporter translocation and assembly factor TamB